MKYLGYIYLGFLIFTAVFLIVAVVIEKNFKEDSKIMKWWRKHVIGIAPDDMDI